MEENIYLIKRKIKKGIWSNLPRDYINNLEKKKVFLNNEFEYLINSIVEVEGIPPAFYETKKKKWKYVISPSKRRTR